MKPRSSSSLFSIAVVLAAAAAVLSSTEAAAAAATCQQILLASPRQCKLDFGPAGLLTPYECERVTDFACCDVTDDTVDLSGEGLGNCTRSGDPLEPDELADCIGTAALAPSDDNDGTTSPGEVCAATFAAPYDTPYECTKGVGYACCAGNQGDRITPGPVLGYCTPYSGGGTGTARMASTTAPLAAVAAAAVSLLPLW